MSTIITASELSKEIWEIIENIALEYPEEDRERLKGVFLCGLGAYMFNGQEKKKKKKGGIND
jgi:hypothetical protein